MSGIGGFEMPQASDSLICPWCGRQNLDVRHVGGCEDAQTGVVGSSYTQILCFVCGVRIDCFGGKDKAIGPIKELIEFRKKG